MYLITVLFVAVDFIYCKQIFHANGIFDSYHNLTELEGYPDVCEEYSSENCAKSWLIKVNEISIRNDNRYANVLYRYESNINKKNLELLKKFQIIFVKLDKSLRLKAKKFRWKRFASASIRKILGKLSKTVESQNESVSRELIEIKNQIEFIYNNGRPCFGKCLSAGEPAIIELFKNERNYDKLTGYWVAWRNVTGARIRDLFVKKVNLGNFGARENGFNDLASFILFEDFEEENFKETVMKLYEDILPLYKELHSFVRYCLWKYYPGKFDKNGPIPAHIFGNVWSQKWVNIFGIIKKCMKSNYRNNFHEQVNEKLEKLSVRKMFEIAEEFYNSIGLFKMSNEFWERSVVEQIPGRVIDCHGSAHDFANGVDFRILMCTKKNLNDFTTIHHEMGHVEYFMAYRNLLNFYRNSANSGFHEAIGDTIALAVKTPEHLHKVGLLSEIPKSKEFDIDYLMGSALEKVVFLPFALTMDSYLWSVYNGTIPSSKLNEYWWDLSLKFQGIKPPVERSEKDFDAGAKYHIAFGIPYIRYFISFIVQFQFYESMCDLTGYTGPLHRCDFYQSKEAGNKLLAMLKQGSKNNWRETMKILTGTKEIKSASLMKFFEPLHAWLKHKNRELNNHIGW